MALRSATKANRPDTGAIRARNAFLSEIHSRFDAVLRGFFSRQGVGPGHVDDLTQEVYLRLARQADFEGIQNIKAFVFATARNLLRDGFRRKRTRGPQLDIESQEHMATETADPLQTLEFSQRLDDAIRVIRELKPAAQRVFVMHRVQGLSHAEVAVELGVSTSSIEKHMIAAIAALKPLRLNHQELCGRQPV